MCRFASSADAGFSMRPCSKPHRRETTQAQSIMQTPSTRYPMTSDPEVRKGHRLRTEYHLSRETSSLAVQKQKTKPGIGAAANRRPRGLTPGAFLAGEIQWPTVLAPR